MTSTAQTGKLYGVGVGPGDPELLTVKAQRVLQSVPVIWVPQAGISAESYAYSIVKGIIDEDRQEVVRAKFPTNDEDAALDVWRGAARDLAVHLEAGRDVAFITEGDPMLYSTFAYVLETIQEEYPHLAVEVVPGVSSVMAAAASAAAPLVHHGQRLAILPAVYGIDDLREAIALYDTIVLMKVNRTLLDALANLERLGLSGRTIYVRRATTERERVVRNIQELSTEDLDYFSLLIIRR
ncbi:MAG: precorrin-2 C(20)-methyltransferase [Dehalococcoidia bacterium]|nr:precorrin-2 C(20)-methyltransferase [Dehalococcoidia bacterium]